MTTNNVFSAEALKGEIVLVTGASRGIGAAIFDACLKAGATVIGTATSEAGAAKITERAQGAKGFGRVLNVADRESSDAFMKAIEAEFGAVTVLVNNAGITRDTLSMRMKDEQWDEVIETNLTGGFRLARACLRGMMKARHGRIISIASIVGMMGNAGQANYAAAKAGTIAMSKSIAREIGARGVTVNCVAPGFIATDMTDALSEAQKAALLAQIPMARLGKPEDIADAVVFLASAAADYITGQVIEVNGGMRM
ncbi:3-oxoacyl-ACP reductase FabG [uncultured Parasutterella sp.]|uniref:3-oxoacyl-ACP reductase FabG n=1 Tax=uncultured Parasutterella sp. TaxID=1263098 RepID=UPI00272ACDB2|nr:3-oxoacyl-ACP reductase FabG [uncultured Parasutterella sp.]